MPERPSGLNEGAAFLALDAVSDISPQGRTAATSALNSMTVQFRQLQLVVGPDAASLILDALVSPFQDQATPLNPDQETVNPEALETATRSFDRTLNRTYPFYYDRHTDIDQKFLWKVTADQNPDYRQLIMEFGRIHTLLTDRDSDNVLYKPYLNLYFLDFTDTAYTFLSMVLNSRAIDNFDQTMRGVDFSAEVKNIRTQLRRYLSPDENRLITRKQLIFQYLLGRLPLTPQAPLIGHTPIESAGFLVYTYNALWRNGITTIEELRAICGQVTPDTLVEKTRNMGAKSLKQISDFLAEQP